MPVAIGCAVQFFQSAVMELVGQGSTVLILLAAGALVFRTFRERYLLAWLLGWVAYLVYRLAGTESLLTHSTGMAAAAYASFVLAVALFATAVLYYTNVRRQLFAVAFVAPIAVAAAVLYAFRPQVFLLAIAVHVLYMSMSAGASIRLALFNRGRRQLGPWLTCLLLLFVHLDPSPNPIHAFPEVDLVIELLLGISMLVIVLDESKARTQRLQVVNAITMATAQQQDGQAVVLRALKQLKRLLGARAAWYRERHSDMLVITQQVGLSERFLDQQRELQPAASYAAEAVTRGIPGLFRVSQLESPLRETLAEEGFEAMALIPVRGNEGVIGVVCIGSAHHRSYTREELDFLLATANQLGVALEKLQLLEQVFRSQRQWASTFDSIDDRILVHDSEFRIIRVNRAMLQRLRRDLSDVVGKLCETVIPQAQAWSGCPYCGSARKALEDAPDLCFGGYTLVSTSSYNEGSDRLGTIHVVKDTTERRAAEEKYRNIFEQMQEGVFISTPEGRLIDCNDAFVRMLGYGTREEVLALDIPREIYGYADQRDAFRQEIAAHNYVRDFEVALRRKDSAIITALENSFATRDASGRIVRYQGFLLDITEKKRAVEEMRRRNRELHALNAIAVIATQSFDLDEILNLTLRNVMELFTADTGSVFLLDRDGTTLRRKASCGHRSKLGAATSEMRLPDEFWGFVKMSQRCTITDRHLLELPDAVREFIDAERLQSWIWALMWSKDKPIGIIGVSSRHAREFSAMDEDLMIAIARQLATTVEKVRLYEETCHAYDDLRRTQEQLLQSEKMSAVGQLISGVAHELNNPLTAILGYAQLLESEGLGERCADYVQKLFKQAQRTQRVVQNLLSFARQRKPQKGQVDLRRVLEDTLALRDYDLKLNNITVERQLEPKLPAVTADAHQLEQVFLNIINNAVDAMLEKARRGVLKVRIFVQGRHVCTEFHDSGPGIKEPGRVFDPFYTTKEVGKGTGLGLSICYGIVKEHGGDVLAMNAAEGGAVFRVLLPASAVLAEPETQTGPRQREIILHGRILVVDDEEAVLDFEQEVLTGAGAEVVGCLRGDEAIAHLKQEWFDAIIIDTKMPGAWGGADLYRWIAENRPSLKASVLFTLSNISEPQTRTFLEETGVPCIVKPFEVADLIAMARRILTKSLVGAAAAPGKAG